MVPQRSPNSASCLITAFAIVFGEPVHKLYGEVGHDGLEMWWPGRKKPFCFRGFHIQEMIDLALNRCMLVTPIECLPQTNDKMIPFSNPPARFENYLKLYRGVLITDTHAVAWDGQKVYDPFDGKIRLYNQISSIREFWIVHKIFK